MGRRAGQAHAAGRVGRAHRHRRRRRHRLPARARAWPATGQAEVLLLARGEHAARLAEHGLVLDFNGARRNAPPAGDRHRRRGCAGQLAGCDWLLFACKSQHTRRLAEQLKPYVSADCRLGSLQNGVDNEPILAEVFDRPVMGGLMRKFFAHITAPGEVEVRGVLEAVLGDYPTGCGAEVDGHGRAAAPGRHYRLRQRRHPPRAVAQAGPEQRLQPAGGGRRSWTPSAWRTTRTWRG